MPELSKNGGDPSTARNAARKAPTMKEFCHTFMEDYSKQRNKPGTQRGSIRASLIVASSRCTHGIRHLATTGIAKSGVPTKVDRKLTGHKTVAMFMHYVHTEDRPVRDAAELVANQRLAITGTSRSMKVTA